MKDEQRYEDGIGETSGSGGSHKRVAWNSNRVRFHLEDDGGRYGGSSSDADKLEDIALGK